MTASVWGMSPCAEYMTLGPVLNVCLGPVFMIVLNTSTWGLYLRAEYVYLESVYVLNTSVWGLCLRAECLF